MLSLLTHLLREPASAFQDKDLTHTHTLRGVDGALWLIPPPASLDRMGLLGGSGSVAKQRALFGMPLGLFLAVASLLIVRVVVQSCTADGDFAI